MFVRYPQAFYKKHHLELLFDPPTIKRTHVGCACMVLILGLVFCKTINNVFAKWMLSFQVRSTNEFQISVWIIVLPNILCCVYLAELRKFLSLCYAVLHPMPSNHSCNTSFVFNDIAKFSGVTNSKLNVV